MSYKPPTSYADAQVQFRRYTQLRSKVDNPNKDTKKERIYDRILNGINAAFPGLDLTKDYSVAGDSQAETAPAPMFDIAALADSFPISSIAPTGSNAPPAPLDGANDSGLFGLTKQTVYLLGAAIVVIAVAFFFVIKKP